MDPNDPNTAVPKFGDNFLPMDFHEQLDDGGNYIGEPFEPEQGEPLDNEDPALNDGLEEEDDESPLKKFARSP